MRDTTNRYAMHGGMLFASISIARFTRYEWSEKEDDDGTPSFQRCRGRVIAGGFVAARSARRRRRPARSGARTVGAAARDGIAESNRCRNTASHDQRGGI